MAIKNPIIDSVKLLMLMMVLLNLFLFTCSTNFNIRRDLKNSKKRLGTHWNRIGKRFEFEEQQTQEFEPLFVTKNEFCSDLWLLKHLARKYEFLINIEKFICKYNKIKTFFLIFNRISNVSICRSEIYDW